MKKKPEDYWYIHGNAYDLNSFATVHPGGKDQLLSVQGRDITEMVYSMHSLASMDRVKQVMEKFKVNEKKSNEPDLFVWNEEGFYGTLSKRVHNYIKSLGPKESHKANNTFWGIVALILMIQMGLIYYWVTAGSYIVPFVVGMISMSIGFMVFHTAGHCGISKDPKVNRFWYNLYANYILGFYAGLWDVHHNYAHHSFTNIYRKDPDVSHSANFIRKNKNQRFRPVHKIQVYTTYFLMIMIPNQWFGQVLQYTFSGKKGKIFGLPLFDRERSLMPVVKYFSMIVLFGALIAYYQGIFFAWASLYIYSTGVGCGYWACVFPNHDTDKAKQSSIDDTKGSDWGVHQIRHSSNFNAPKYISYLMGGMNYQIEHHLFPCVHPRHYPAISKIVQEECKKNKIEYNCHSSWLDALKGNYKHLKKMSIPISLKSSDQIMMAFKLHTLS